jgi:hypothetical protein
MGGVHKRAKLDYRIAPTQKKFPRDKASARSVGELHDLGRNVTGASGSKRAITCSGLRVVT